MLDFLKNLGLGLLILSSVAISYAIGYFIDPPNGGFHGLFILSLLTMAYAIGYTVRL